eukprot:GHVQ01000452.1.p1 GENE.GHVQ01000452.1~~GHVQ01000452.1.p1  ORF type:complete len:101 (+),score=18.57 GHVQ01000452.1:181-483(+)
MSSSPMTTTTPTTTSATTTTTSATTTTTTSATTTSITIVRCSQTPPQPSLISLPVSADNGILTAAVVPPVTAMSTSILYQYKRLQHRQEHVCVLCVCVCT